MLPRKGAGKAKPKVPTARIQTLPLEQLGALAVGEAFSAGVTLLDFTGPADLAAWLAEHAG